MKYITILLLLFVSSVCAAQADKDIRIDMPGSKVQKLPGKDAIYPVAEVNPSLVVEGVDWQKYVSTHIKYTESMKSSGKRAFVMVRFVIEKDGTTSNLKVLAPVCAECDLEALRLVKESKWKPGMVDGEPVRCSHLAPVPINMN